jgi:hypothetical protein
MPKGSRYVFRYSRERVDDPIAETEENWKQIEGKQGLVCFSLQQKAKYFLPVFIPVRAVTLKDARIIGSTHIVEFELGELVAIRPEKEEDARPAQIRAFTEWVCTGDNVRSYPYTRSISLGRSADAQLWRGEADQPLIFEALSWWLSRAESFIEARFVRFERLVQAGADGTSATVDDQGRLGLEAGKTYDLRLVQHQGEEISDKRPFVVSTDNAHVTVIGRAGFDVASRYDEISLGLQVVPMSGVKAVETVIVIEPASGGKGPRLQLPIRIKPPESQVVLSVIGPVLVLAVLGVPTAFNAKPSVAVPLVFVALIGTALLQFLGINVTAPSNPFPAASAPTTVTINTAGQQKSASS